MSALPLSAPVILAAGCSGRPGDLSRFGDPAALGAVTTPTLRSPLPARPGSRPSRSRRAEEEPLPVPDGVPPRLVPVPGGLVVDDRGVRPDAATHLRRVMPGWVRAGVPVVASVGGTSGPQFAETVTQVLSACPAGSLAAVEVALHELADDDGLPFDATPETAVKVVGRVRERLSRGVGLWVRLHADGADPVEVARACGRAGGVTAIVVGAPGRVTLPATSGSPGPVDGLLVGPHRLGATVRTLLRLREAQERGRVPRVPLIAGGGVHDVAAALACRDAGAAAVQVGSGLLADPTLPWSITERITA